MDDMGRENLITIVLFIFLFALMFGGGSARNLEERRPQKKFPSRESVARAKTFLDDNPVVDGWVQLLSHFACQVCSPELLQRQPIKFVQYSA